jgi:hypothetical protein
LGCFGFVLVEVGGKWVGEIFGFRERQGGRGIGFLIKMPSLLNKLWKLKASVVRSSSSARIFTAPGRRKRRRRRRLEFWESL